MLDLAGRPATGHEQAVATLSPCNAETSPTAHQLLARRPPSDDPRPRLEVALWSAVLDDLDGEKERALARMAGVVAEAQEQGHIRLFLDAGDQVLDLARVLYRRDPTPFLRTVVEHPGAAALPRGPVKGLVEQLTDREQMVLSYLPSRLSNAEIAAELRVSLNTLKSHLKHIYRKLGVAGRNDAITKAERHRLL